MHPHAFYANYFEHEKRDEVFVVMSFAAEFNDRWTNVIEPCIREDLKLKANRVDFNVSGESVVRDILDGIAHARLVLIDITSSDMRDRRGDVWPQRNGNVMWELGVTHVMRMPDEVLVVKSDDDESIFDLTQFRAFKYDPTDVARSRKFICDLLQGRISSINTSMSEYVKSCASLLDAQCMLTLTSAVGSVRRTGNGISHPTSTLGNSDTIRAISRLLELGALKTEFSKVTATTLEAEASKKISNRITYKATEFGMSILAHFVAESGFSDPAVQAAIKGQGSTTSGILPPRTSREPGP